MLESASSFQLLAASVAVLAVGPLLHKLARKRGAWHVLLDGFVLVAVGGLAVFEVIPHGFEMAGAPALVAALAGVALPLVLASRLGRAQTNRTALFLALSGMAVHAFMDGAALAGGAHVDGIGLELAVVLHRLPVGLAVWWLLVDREPPRPGAAISVLAAIAAATVLGWGLGQHSLGAAGDGALGLFEAFIGGLLLHVISHGHTVSKNHRHIEGFGGLVGLLALAVVFADSEHRAGMTRWMESFVELLLESAPALLLAYGLAGILSGTLGEAPARFLRKGGSLGQAARGVVFGLPLPLCSCGVVPVYRSLVKRGVPATAAFAFLVATPELGLDAVLLSLPLLGPELAGLRVVAAFALALIVGVVVGSYARRMGAQPAPVVEASPDERPPPPWSTRLADGLKSGYGEVLDGTGPWILLGLAVAAVADPWLDAEVLTSISPVTQLLLCAIIGVPIYICATGATPFVAVLVAKGLSPGAALALLLTGPATNATTYGVLKSLHGRKVAIAFAGAIVGAVVLFGLGVDLGLGHLDIGASAVAHEHGGHSWFAVACACVLGGLFVASFVRQGARGFVGRLYESAGHDEHDDDHDHEHGHGHEHGDSDESGCCHG